MKSTRRHMLKGLALLPGLAVPLTPTRAGTSLQPRVRFVVDRRLPGGKALAGLATAGGHDLAEPRGEIVAEFLGDKSRWLDGTAPLIGLTGYSEMVLMRDLARSAGLPMRYATRWGNADTAPLICRKLDEPTARLIASLQKAPAGQSRGGATSFLWLV